MSNLPSLRERLFNNAGAVLNLGKLYFYESGASTTPLDTYTTAAMNVANTNPVVADAYGLFPEIYLQLNTEYRVVCKDSSNNTIFTLDNIYADTLEGSGLATQFYETNDNPNHYGADGNGDTDETSYVQAAINAAVTDANSGTRTGVVDLLGRRYNCSSALTLRDGVTLRNGTLDFSNCEANAYLVAQKTYQPAVTLTANAAAGDMSIQVTTYAGISSGDWIYLYDSTGTLNGEMCRVASTSGAAPRIINLTAALNDPYTTANTASYKQLFEPLEDIRLENLVIISDPGAAAGAGRVLHLEGCENTIVSNCRFEGHKAAAIEVRSSINTRIVDCTIGQSESGINSQGINVCDQSRDTFIEGCRFSRQDGAAIEIGTNTGGGTGGVTRNVFIADCILDGGYASADAAIVAGLQSQYVTIDNCRICGSSADTSAGIMAAGYHTTIRGTSVSMFADEGILGNFSSSRSTASGGRRLVIDGNAITNTVSAAFGMYVDNSSAVSGTTVAITNNTVASPAWGASASFVRCDDVSNLTIAGNTCSDGAGSPTVTDGIYVYAASVPVGRVTVAGNTINGINSSGYGIRIRGATAVNKVAGATLASNMVKSTGYAVFLDGYVDGCAVTGNSLEAGNATASVILMTGGAAAGVNNVTVTGNVMREGVLAYSATNNALVSLDGNAIYGQSGFGGMSGILYATKTLGAAEIVGSTAGTLGHADGVTLVTAVSGKHILPVDVVVVFTFATAAYTAGGNTYISHGSVGTLTGSLTAGASFGRSSSGYWVYRPSSSAMTTTGKNLAIVADAAFTQPGTAASTAIVYTYYRLVDTF